MYICFVQNLFCCHDMNTYIIDNFRPTKNDGVCIFEVIILKVKLAVGGLITEVWKVVLNILESHTLHSLTYSRP